MKASILKNYLTKVPHQTPTPNIFLTLLFSYYKEKIAFHEISFANRSKGINSINLFKIIRIGMIVIKDLKRVRFKIIHDNIINNR